MTERDDENHRAPITVSGRDEHGESQVEVAVTPGCTRAAQAHGVRVRQLPDLVDWPA